MSRIGCKRKCPFFSGYQIKWGGVVFCIDLTSLTRELANYLARNVVWAWPASFLKGSLLRMVAA